MAVRAKKATVVFDNVTDARAMIVDTLGMSADKIAKVHQAVLSNGYCPFWLDGTNHVLGVTRDGREWWLEDVTEGAVVPAGALAIAHLAHAITRTTADDDDFDATMTRAAALYGQSTRLGYAAQRYAAGRIDGAEFVATVREIVG